jgi:hypothetical protein
MPKRKTKTDSAEKVSVDKPNQDNAQDLDKSTVSDKLDSISKNKPNPKVINDHKFHNVVDGRNKATKVLYFQKNEGSKEAENRLREQNWISDETEFHISPNEREFHEGDPSKCPNCAKYLRKNKTGTKSNEPTLSSQPLNSVEDVEKAWTTIPANTVPYFEFNYFNGEMVVPLVSQPLSVNRALAMFKVAERFSSEKPELKARIVGKAESHECPDALEVKLRLSTDLRTLLNKLDVRGWTPALIGANELKEKKVTLKPRIEVVYTPQVVKLEVINTLRDSFKLKEDDFKPKEDNNDGRSIKEGNDTTEKSDK